MPAKNRQSFYQLLLSFMAVILLCFLLVIVLIVRSAADNLNAVNDSYRASADAVMNSMSDYIQYFQEYAEMLAAYNDGTEIAHIAAMDSEELRHYNLSALSGQLSDLYSVANKIPGAMNYLYFINSNYAYRTRDSQDALADGEIFNMLGITQEDWDTLISAGEDPVSIIEQTEIMDFPRLLLAKEIMEDVVFISAVPSQTIIDQMNKHYLPDNSQVLILTNNNQYLISGQESDIDQTFSYQEFLSELSTPNSTQKTTLNGQDYYLYVSQVGGCDLISVVLIPDILTSVFRSHVIRTILTALLLWILIGGITSWFLARKLYQPVALILSSLPDLPSASESDIAQLQYFVNTLVNRNESYQETLQKQQLLLSSSIFMRLLNRNIRWSADLETYLSEAGFPQNPERYIVFVLTAATVDSPLSVTNVDQHIPYEICLNIKNTLLTQGYDSFVISSMDTFIGFLDLTGQETLPDFDQLCQPDMDLPGLIFSVALSNTFDSLDELSHAYAQAAMAADTLLLSKEAESDNTDSVSGKVLYYRDIRPASHAVFSWRKFLSCLEHICTQIDMADFASAESTLQELCERIVSSGCSSEECRTYMKYLIQSISISLLNHPELDTDQVRIMLNKSALSDRETVSGLQKKLCTILQELPEHLKHNSKDQDIIEQIRNYVRENYADSMISAGAVAEHFAVSLPWLSVHFKEQVGVGFLDHLHQCRLSAAKDMLMHTNESMQTIALRCGYTSAATFSRSFRKYEGVTPSWYRQNHEA